MLKSSSAPNSSGDMKPILLLPAPSKLMERIILQRLMSSPAVNSHDLQDGFNTGHQQLQAVLQTIVFVGSQAFCTRCKRGLRPAVDRVWLPALIVGLKNRGLPLSMCKVAHSYPDNRRI